MRKFRLPDPLEEMSMRALLSLAVIAVAALAPPTGHAWAADTAARLATYPYGLKPVLRLGDRAAFDALTANDWILWTSDGTAAGTTPTAPVFATDEAGVARRGLGLFNGSDNTGSGFELWTSDGTSSGTHMVADVSPGTADSWLSDFVEWNDVVYFVGNAAGQHRALWRSDGTAAGTYPVTAPGGAVFWFVSRPVACDGALFFAGSDDHVAVRLWRMAAGAPPAALGPSQGVSDDLSCLAGEAFFTATGGQPPARDLWRSDGTEPGTQVVASFAGLNSPFPAFLTPVVDRLYFFVGNQLWRTSGTGAELVKDLALPAGGRIRTPTAVGGRLVFNASDDFDRGVLWTSDGSAAGTVPLATPSDRFPFTRGDVTAAGGRLYFPACRDVACVPESTSGLPGDVRAVVTDASTQSVTGFLAAGRHVYVATRDLGGSYGLWTLRLAANPKADWDGDGRDDLLWQEAATGQLRAGLLADGLQVRSTWPFAPGAAASPDWRVVGTPDLDGDGRPDLLWRHGVSGRLVAWFMNGTLRRSGGFLQPDLGPGTGWSVVGTGAFGGSQSADILWRRAADGSLLLWLMNGTQVDSTAPVVPGAVADLNWVPVAVADLDRDGDADILWQHSLSGRLVAWVMDGATRVSGVTLVPSEPSDPSWRFASVADVDWDGQPDLLWRHWVSGRLVVWLMDGLTRRHGALLSPGSALPGAWELVGPR